MNNIYYIVVNDDDEKKVVSTSNGRPREFLSRKKAQNYINGRMYLEERDAGIVTEIFNIKHRFRVDI
jgi:hypothetical protein